MNKEEVNKVLRDSFKNILNREPTEREKEIREIARQEKEEYEKKRADFYNNPLYWDNNKRRRYGLPALRGKVNRCRTKRYPSFRPSAYFFCTLGDIIEETISSKLSSSKFFNEFVDFKNVDIGEQNKYYVGVDLANGKDFNNIKSEF